MDNDDLAALNTIAGVFADGHTPEMVEEVYRRVTPMVGAHMMAVWEQHDAAGGFKGDSDHVARTRRGLRQLPVWLWALLFDGVQLETAPPAGAWEASRWDESQIVSVPGWEHNAACRGS